MIKPEEIDASERTERINKLTALPSGDLIAEDGRRFQLNTWNSTIQVGCVLRIEAVLYPVFNDGETEFFE
jgi:hypothetical protein